MSTQVEPRVEVGKCDLGYVFIYHKASKGDYTDKPERDTWQVRAGNHTIGTYDTEDGANAVARALVGEQQLTNEYVADAPGPGNSPAGGSTMDATSPTPAPEPEYVAPARARVLKK